MTVTNKIDSIDVGSCKVCVQTPRRSVYVAFEGTNPTQSFYEKGGWFSDKTQVYQNVRFTNASELAKQFIDNFLNNSHHFVHDDGTVVFTSEVKDISIVDLRPLIKPVKHLEYNYGDYNF